MPLYRVKLVPDAEPNSDGSWHLAEVPPGLLGRDFWNWVPKEGYHIVGYEAYSPQDGGPMPANFLPQPTPDFVWQHVGDARPRH